MPIKAIAFVRVSTTQQDYQRQITDLLPLIKSDGYKDEEITVIKHKESATKNNVSNRKSIAELNELIKNNPIEAVYVQEISRLSRRSDVMYAVLSVLEEREIALVVQTPSIIRTYRREGDKWQRDGYAHLILQFLEQAAVNEIENKKTRQKSGYAQKVKDGKVCSSRVKFGYTRVNGFAEINEEQASIVRDIFKLYLQGLSVTAIWDKYNFTGKLKKLPNKSGWNLITRILRDPTYIGKNPKYKYPVILDESIFYSAQDKMSSNQLIKSKLKYVYYCQGLLMFQGHVMSPSVCGAVYSYRNTETYKTTGINMNAMDSLLWHLSCTAKIIMNNSADENRMKNLREQLSLINTKLEGIKQEKIENEMAMERANNLYVKGKINEEKYDFLISDLEDQLNHLLQEENQLRLTQDQIKDVEKREDKDWVQKIKDYNTIRKITDDQLRQDIIRECIDYVNIEKNENGIFTLMVFYKDTTLMDGTLYRYVQKGCKKKLYRLWNGYQEDISNIIVDRIKYYDRKKGAEH